ncbi:site-specific integrase [Lysinibacillus fusiformis]|uniref:site-specific integrase n=1 Tax=Lysinibacillus fusiformis TaxID=28031 RepID=UPI00355933E9
MQLHAAIDEFVLYIEIEKNYSVHTVTSYEYDLAVQPVKRDHQDPSTSIYPISIIIIKTTTSLGEQKNFFLKIVH